MKQLGDKVKKLSAEKSGEMFSELVDEFMRMISAEMKTENLPIKNPKPFKFKELGFGRTISISFSFTFFPILGAIDIVKSMLLEYLNGVKVLKDRKPIWQCSNDAYMAVIARMRKTEYWMELKIKSYASEHDIRLAFICYVISNYFINWKHLVKNTLGVDNDEELLMFLIKNSIMRKVKENIK